MEEIINELKNTASIYLNVYDKIKILDKHATFRPFYHCNQKVGIKIIFDCILTNSAIKYIFDVCNEKELNLRLIAETNKFALLIFKNIK